MNIVLFVHETIGFSENLFLLIFLQMFSEINSQAWFPLFGKKAKIRNYQPKRELNHVNKINIATGITQFPDMVEMVLLMS